jgi:hypothetical protein
MRDQISSQLRSITVKCGNIPLRFFVLDEPDAEVRVVLGDILSVAGYPTATWRQVQESVPAAELCTIGLQGRQTLLVQLDTARELMIRAAELDHCPAYQTDVFEVIASYARDELSSCGPCAAGDLVDVLDMEGGE